MTDNHQDRSQAMTEIIRFYMPWLMSAVTIWMTLLAGNKHKSAWLVGIGNQALWLTWIVTVDAWGLIPMMRSKSHDPIPNP